MAPSEEIEIRSVGHYAIECLVGRGGMGNVFRATDTRLERTVALKIPRIDVVGNPNMRDRFLHEARIAAKLNHPGLVEIYEYGAEQAMCYVATRWCDGGDLAHWIHQNPQPHDAIEVARFMQQLCKAVAHCHDSGILHLDIKPGNIMLDGAEDSSSLGNPLLADFGLAQIVEQSLAETHTSLIMGTPLYMSPEQAECRTKDFGPHTDVFALGVVMHELLYQSRPFEGNSTVELLDKIRSCHLEPSTLEKKTPYDLRSIWKTCLQRHPSDRYRDAGELAEDLQRFLDQRPLLRLPPSPWKRLGYWLQSRERMRHAGLAMVVIQFAGIVGFPIWGLLMALGLSPIQGDTGLFFAQTLLIICTINFASVWLGVMAMRLRWWSIPFGLAFSLLYFFAVSLTLVGVIPELAIYESAPDASFIGHLLNAILAATQTTFILLALPAARAHHTRS